MEIRQYREADREECLRVFDSIAAAEDRGQFCAYLGGGPAQFYVAEHNGAIVGCGGFEANGREARLVWGMVHGRWQRQGLGRFLLFYRMREITRAGAVDAVFARVPAAVAGFFAGQGFREIGPAEGGVEMVKRLVVCP
jgi:N-acetylglutamate synthase-like GNAT family acetyltransferase